MIAFDVFLVQLDNGVGALVDVQVEPIAFDPRLADAHAGGEPAPMVAPRAVGGHQLQPADLVGGGG